MIYVCEHHQAVLELWRREGRRGIRLAHLDFHDDLRGLLIDRRRARAYPIGALARGAAPLDAGNFLAHAVLENRLEQIRWIHDRCGGRAFDAGIVRYQSDLFALPHRLRQALRRAPEAPLVFEERQLESWGGLETGERLSIDWDCFASILQDPSGIETRVAAFLDRLGSQLPPDTYLAYSPEYSRPSIEPFKQLANTLAARFRQPVEWLSPALERGELHPSGVDPLPPRTPLMALILFLRRRGLF
ncbi:MAG TPA: hypothetical protein VGB99_10540 [Acidobacteriota bacterium]